MKTQRLLGLILVLALLATLGEVMAASPPLGAASPGGAPAAAAGQVELARTTGSASSRAQQAIIIDHNSTDLGLIPDFWIERAKAQLRASYGHTSHGSQPISGMGVLMVDPLNNGLYNFNTYGAIEAGVLSIADSTPSGDLGNPDRVTWAARTREYLNGAGGDRNVVIWSWCGQAGTSDPSHIETYLTLMDELETDFPDVAFVYMTGHLVGTGVDGDLYARNNQIRAYCLANDKILYDFADIESYDPDGNYYPNENDSCGWC